MSEGLNLDHLIYSRFVSESHHHPLEMTGRMILAAAALEDARYGHNEERLLRLYQKGSNSTRAEYKKTLNTNGERFERLVVDLGKSAMTIILEQGATNWNDQASLFTNKAVLAPTGSSHVTRINDDIVTERPFTKTTFDHYSLDLQDQLENFEIILPEPSFFRK